MPRTSVLYEKRAMGRDYVDLDCSFAPNGSSAVSAASNRGRGLYSVTRTGAGLFTLTFTDDFIALVAACATVQFTTDATDIYVQLGDFTAGTSSARPTLKLRTMTATTPTDIAANANNRIFLKLTFRKGDVTP
jgi:hypothetical protein